MAAVMQMDIDIDAVLLGHTEDDVEMALDVAVEGEWIKPADKFAPRPDGSSSKFRRAGDFSGCRSLRKATSWISMRSRYSSRTLRIVSSDFSPTEPSTITWLRICSDR